MFIVIGYCSFQNLFKLCVTDGDAAIAVFAPDKELSQRASTMSATVDNAELSYDTSQTIHE